MWKYKVQYLLSAELEYSLEFILNEFGEKGWELCEIVSQLDSENIENFIGQLAVFKKKI